MPSSDPSPLRAVATRPSLGVTLRRARGRRKLSVEQAAEATRISPVYLRALEQDGPLEGYPAPVFAQYFLREYARYLGLDQDSLVQAFETQFGPLQAPPLRGLPVSKRPRSHASGVLVALIASLAVAAAVVVGLAGHWRSPQILPQFPRFSPILVSPSGPSSRGSTHGRRSRSISAVIAVNARSPQIWHIRDGKCTEYWLFADDHIGRVLQQLA